MGWWQYQGGIQSPTQQRNMVATQTFISLTYDLQVDFHKLSALSKLIGRSTDAKMINAHLPELGVVLDCNNP